MPSLVRLRDSSSLSTQEKQIIERKNPKNNKCFILKIYFKDGQISIENHYTEGKMSDQWIYYNDDERHTVNRVINY